ncbi:MAG: hypothetical protein V7K20_23020 [Nostoc sp.]
MHKCYIAKYICDTDSVPLLKSAQAMGEVFAAIRTSAVPPKPRGKSPGWLESQTRTRRIRYPISLVSGAKLNFQKI